MVTLCPTVPSGVPWEKITSFADREHAIRRGRVIVNWDFTSVPTGLVTCVLQGSGDPRARICA